MRHSRGHAIYTRNDNIINFGDVSPESQTRLLTGSELIADIDNNKRILNSANNESLVEVLLKIMKISLLM